jgi:hypothetical protein
MIRAPVYLLERLGKHKVSGKGVGLSGYTHIYEIISRPISILIRSI